MKSPVHPKHGFVSCYLRLSSRAQVKDDASGVPRQLESFGVSLKQIDESLELSEQELKRLFEEIVAGPDSWTIQTESGVPIFVDIQSGKSPGRKSFEALRSELMSCNSGHLIIWHRNRLQRSSDKSEEAELLMHDITSLLSTTLTWHNITLWEDGAKQVTEGMAGRIVTSVITESELLESTEREGRLVKGRLKAFLDGKNPGQRLSWWHTSQKLKAREIVNLEGLDIHEATTEAGNRGYQDPHKMYLDNEHVEMAMKNIIPLVEQNLSADEVAERLNELGIPSGTWRTTKPKKWIGESVTALFGNHAQGILHWRDRLTGEVHTKQFEALVVPGLTSENIIQLKNMLLGNAKRMYRPRRDQARDWLLHKGLLRCSTCGESMTTKTKGGRGETAEEIQKSTLFYYNCRNGCVQANGKKGFPAQELEAEFIETIKDFLFLGKLWPAWEEKRERLLHKGGMQERLDEIKKEIATLDAQIDMGTSQILKKDKAWFEKVEKQIDALQVKKVKLEQERAEIKVEVNLIPTQDMREQGEEYLKWACDQLKLFDGMEYDEQLKYLHQLVEWCAVVPDASPDDRWAISWRGRAPAIGVLSQEAY